MTISNAIPVQFWLNGQQVFNEKVEDGIEEHKFYQKFNKDDSVKLQFTDTTSKIYRLTIFSCDDEQLAQLDFTSELVESEYVYSLEFDFETQGIDSGLVWLQISEFAYTYDVSGALTDLMDVVTGTATFTPASLIFEISGDIEDLMDEVTGGIEILAQIGITNSSLDIIVTGVLVDGVATDYESGTALPISTGFSGIQTTKKTGTYDIVVNYNVPIAGQRITLIDSDGNPFCNNTDLSGTMTFVGVVIKPESPLSMEPQDGVCV